MFSTAAVLVGIIGATTLAAQQIVYGVLYLAMSFAGGFADAVRVRVAYFVGREEPQAARQSARIALSLAAISTFAACLVLWLFPEQLVGVFLAGDDADNLEVLSVAISLSAAAGVFLLLDCTQMVLANALRGLRDTRSPLWVALVGYWAVGLGSGTFLAFGMGYGAIGLWWGLAAGVVLCNLLLIMQLRKRFAAALHAPGPEGTMA
jgi:MATE family multidrug resistance protein